jgi:hypothetical protein
LPSSHQPLHLLAGESDARELGIDQLQLFAVEVELAQERLARSALVEWQLLLGQPGAALVAEEVGGRAARDEVAVQDRLHPILQPGALPHDVRPPGDLASKVSVKTGMAQSGSTGSGLPPTAR